MSSNNERILWGWTIFNGLISVSWTITWLILAGFASLILLLGLFIAFLFWEEAHRFSQPRDALPHAPSYVQVHTDAERYCSVGCSQEQLDLFLEARDEAVIADWPKLLEVTMQNWRWHQHSFVQFSMGWQIRDDYFNLIELVGGRTAAEQCTPIVDWNVRGTYIQESFKGLLCNDREYLLTY
jgi:hypothetical protein